MERDKFLSPGEAKAFGIIDDINISRPVPAGSDAAAAEKKPA